MNPDNLETNETLNIGDINFEVTNISKENFNITPLPNQNLNLSSILQKWCTAYPSTPLKGKTKSLPEETCNNHPKASTPNPHKWQQLLKLQQAIWYPQRKPFHHVTTSKYCNSSKMLIFLLETSSNIDKFDKLRKSAWQIDNSSSRTCLNIAQCTIFLCMESDCASTSLFCQSVAPSFFRTTLQFSYNFSLVVANSVCLFHFVF